MTGCIKARSSIETTCGESGSGGERGVTAVTIVARIGVIAVVIVVVLLWYSHPNARAVDNRRSELRVTSGGSIRSGCGGGGGVAATT